MLRHVLALLLVCSAAVSAFQLAPMLPRSQLQRPCGLVMQEAPPPDSKPEEETTAALPTGGYSTVYDDEVPEDTKPPVSSSMRDRLIKEQRSMGADPNSGSPFLGVFGAVGVFVILGALAVNM